MTAIAHFHLQPAEVERTVTESDMWFPDDAAHLVVLGRAIVHWLPGGWRRMCHLARTQVSRWWAQ